jgi:hypothetical protein
VVSLPTFRGPHGPLALQVCLFALLVNPAFGAVLPPEAGARLGIAFAELGPAWELREAAVNESEVEGTLCAGEDCYEVRLTEPSPICEGLLLPAWCVNISSGSPDELRTAIKEEFGGHRLSDFWLVPDADVGGLGIADKPPSSVLFPVLLALALLLLPIPAGWALGAGLRLLRGGRVAPVWGALLMLLVPLAPAFLIPLKYLPTGFYDLAGMGLLVGSGLVAGGHRWGGSVGRREVFLAVGALTLAALAVEVVVRLALPAPAAFPPPSEATIEMVARGAGGVGGQACKGLFPERFPEVVQERDRVPGRARRVLHVGDSMVEGVGVEPGERFVSRLNQVDDATAHINAGFSGTGPEFYYLATRRWQALGKSDLVIWYLYLFNDIDGGLQEPYGCCDGFPLLAYGEEGFEVTCPEWKVTVEENRFKSSPAPYPLRVATAYFRTAGHLVELHNRVVQLSHREAVPLDEALRRTGLVLREAAADLAQQSVEFTVILLPYRGALEGDAEVRRTMAPMLDGVLELCDSLGIRCLDGSEAFGALTESGTVEAGFINEPVWDYHFSAEGHRIVAEWLVGVLGLGGA